MFDPTLPSHHRRCAMHIDHALRCTCEAEQAHDDRVKQAHDDPLEEPMPRNLERPKDPHLLARNLETPASALARALRHLAAAVAVHPDRDRLAERLWCYDMDEDLSIAAGFDVRDQTLGDVLHALLRDDDSALSVLGDHGLLDDLRTSVRAGGE